MAVFPDNKVRKSKDKQQQGRDIASLFAVGEGRLLGDTSDGLVKFGGVCGGQVDEGVLHLPVLVNQYRVLDIRRRVDVVGFNGTVLGVN